MARAMLEAIWGLDNANAALIHEESTWVYLTKGRRTRNGKCLWDSSGVRALYTTSNGQIFGISYKTKVLYKYVRKNNAFIPVMRIKEPDVLWKFNLDNAQIYNAQIAWDEEQSKITIYTRNSRFGKNLIILKLKESLTDGEIPVVQQTNEFANIPDTPYIIFIGDYVHFIRNQMNHIIKFKEDDKMIDILTIQQNTGSRRYGAAIYIPSKNYIVLFGGLREGRIPVTDIWIFSLITQVWSKVEAISLSRWTFGAVLTADEKYILIFGGYTIDNGKEVPTDKILVLDMTKIVDWKLIESKIKCPFSGVCNVTKTQGLYEADEILVIGWIKRCFKAKSFKQLQMPAIHILMLIRNWYTTERIHYIKNYVQCEICTNDLLSEL